MESTIYGYYFIKTDCISNALNTTEIESFLVNKNCFSNETKGHFKHKSSFLTISLLNVKNYDSWNGNDYNHEKTNYIDIITTKKLSQEITDFFCEFENFLGLKIIEETE